MSAIINPEYGNELREFAKSEAAGKLAARVVPGAAGATNCGRSTGSDTSPA